MYIWRKWELTLLREILTGIMSVGKFYNTKFAFFIQMNANIYLSKLLPIKLYFTVFTIFTLIIQTP